MTLTNILKILYTLSKAENAEENGHSTKIPMGLIFPPDTAAQEKLQMEYLEAERPARDALTAFVKGLDKKTLMAISALMYSGRDGNGLDLDDYDRQEPEEMSRSILEKTPRSFYIAAGVERYGATRIDKLAE